MEIKRGDIVYLHKGAYKSILGAGNLQTGSRPLLVISNDVGNHFSNIAIVVPLTLKKKNHLPTHCGIGDSVALCEQIFTVNQSDIYRIIAHVSDKEIKAVEHCIKISLGI